MAAISSIRTSGDRIEIIDQLLLPHTQEWIEIDTVEKAYEAIKSMKARTSHILVFQVDLSRFFGSASLDSGGAGYRFTRWSLSGIVHVRFAGPGPTPEFPCLPA
jgi:hypothetical protein